VQYQYSRDFWLLENARNPRAYSNRIGSFCVFQCPMCFSIKCFSYILWVFCRNTSKHTTLTKHSQNTTTRKTSRNTRKHHKTPHILSYTYLQHTFHICEQRNNSHKICQQTDPRPRPVPRMRAFRGVMAVGVARVWRVGGTACWCGCAAAPSAFCCMRLSV